MWALNVTFIDVYGTYTIECGVLTAINTGLLHNYHSAVKKKTPFKPQTVIRSKNTDSLHLRTLPPVYPPLPQLISHKYLHDVCKANMYQFFTHKKRLPKSKLH
jgi:hypothetical protein